MVMILSKSASDILNGFKSVPPCAVTVELPPEFREKSQCRPVVSLVRYHEFFL